MMNPEEKLRQLSSIKLDPKILPRQEEGTDSGWGWGIIEIIEGIGWAIEAVFAILGALFHH
jgi:hypothetical protein